MKIVILEAESLGEDMKLDRFFEIGEVAIYGKQQNYRGFPS